MKYVLDPSVLFTGAVLTSMSDGVHDDYEGKTIEELREIHHNPCLQVMSEESVMSLAKDYEDRLHNGPVEEITEEDYWDSLDCLPPVRNSRDYFFVGEPYYGNIYPFCFKAEGRYFRCRKKVDTPSEQLRKEIDDYMASLAKSEEV